MNKPQESSRVKKILLAEDETDVRNMLVLTLEQAGYEVAPSSHGQEALEKLSSEDFHPDLIITDVLMPVMDGFAFYKALKENTAFRDIPVIILTARGAMQDAFDAVGVDAFLEKTSGTQALIAQVEELLTAGGHARKSSLSQRVLIFGTYPEVVQEMEEFLASRNHKIKVVQTGAQIITDSVNFGEDIIIMEPQLEDGKCAVDVIKAIRVLPQFKDIPILIYSFYRSSELSDPDIRKRVLRIDDHAQQCILAGATQYLDRYHIDIFREQISRYL